MPADPSASLPTPDLTDPSLYINRELSWLAFNRRVLEEGQDPNVPLLERLKFLAIFSSNLDEFFMVRVGGLQQKVQAGISRSSGADKMTPHDQLERIGIVVRELVADQYRGLNEDVLPQLKSHGVVIRSHNELTADEHRHVRAYFKDQIFPVLTPLAIDPGHPFPHLLNKSLNLAVRLKRPNDADELYAVVQVPSLLPRFAPLPAESGFAFIPLEDVIRLHLGELFPGMELGESVSFRVTRDNEFELDDEVDDLLRAIENFVKQRRRGHAVRLELESIAPPDVELFLINALDIDPSDVYRVPGLLDLTGLFQLHALPGFNELRDPLFVPVPVLAFSQSPSPWAVIRSKDILLHHPYESFKHVVDFIEAAATDDRVLAIKQTLYRTSSDSPVVRALARAADRGKQVTAVIELKARLDEERNIVWAKELEKAGVHVVFGFVGLKTHCKVALVVRRDEDNSLRRYVHLSTGNYNPQTANTYTDLGFFTAKTEFADDVTLLFNHLTGYAELPQYRKLILAPQRMLDFMVERIERETANRLAGKPARISAKLNGLLEPAVVQALYRASQAGVPIEICCRGVCALRPGVPGVSDTIRVTSVVDRFLEHSRIFYFENGGEPDVYIGSADWMDRNLTRRVEVVFPIEQPDIKQRVIEEILKTSLEDTVKARVLMPDGTYKRVEPRSGDAPLRSQSRFLQLATEAEKRSVQTPTVERPKPIPANAPGPKVVRRTPRKDSK
ncbi:MAG: polyphosphate kinase 1 [Gemmataceae bacterium]